MKRGTSLNMDQSPTPTFMSIDDIFYNGDLAQSFFEFLTMQNKTRLAEFVFDAGKLDIVASRIATNKYSYLSVGKRCTDH